ncbi:hypothetical protein ACFOKI_11670 [Sphingomonas qilianensis]|uniref:TonB-dependent receptor n=1 Tax=Sphingomonas qilianensis TaxID=1736690 RepID=A0ABU9XRA9_9SPHN
MAQDTGEAPSQSAPAEQAVATDVVVTGRRGTAVSNVDPLAEIDAQAIAATGASTVAELMRTIRGVTQSASGGEPIFLFNGQRVSSGQEIFSLPPEAIDKIEVLSEPAALKYGYPPTRRLVNVISKRRFEQTEVRGMIGGTTRGNSARGTGNVGLTRLRDNARLTLGVELRHTDPVRQSQRDIVPNPDIVFDAIGNITGRDGAEIDPALSAAAGGMVTVAPVPEAVGARTLAGFAADANRPRPFDLGPYRWLAPRNDAVKGELVLADRIGDLSGSLNLSAEQSRDRNVSGPATAILVVPGSNPASPFAGPVLLNRYLTEVDPLRLHQTTTTLHAGVAVRGALAAWRWDATIALDQKRVSGATQLGVDLAPAAAAIAGGVDPFAPLDPALLSERQTDRARLRTRNGGIKTVASSMPFDVPAGGVNMTLTAEAERSSAISATRGANPSALSLGRTRIEGGFAIDLPIASKREDVLPALGELSVNGAATVRTVGGFGGLNDRSYGMSWAPFPGLQMLAQIKHSEAAPNFEMLSSPIVRITNVPAFDYRNGRTELITVIQGGNPDLLAERRQVRSLTMTLKPFAKRELRLSATYDATAIRNQTGTVYAFTPQIEPILPDLFVRDGAGRLVSQTFQPINFYREDQRALNLTISANGPLGRPPPPPATGAPPAAERVFFYVGAGPSIKFSDRLQLMPGAPTLDLLRGDTVTGGGSPRLSSYAYGGISHRGTGGTFDFWYGGANRVRNADRAANLRFAAIFKLNMGVFVGLDRLLPKQDWARKLQLKIDISNVTDARQSVRDGNGRVPNRFQRDYLDPVGRTISLTLRKLF